MNRTVCRAGLIVMAFAGAPCAARPLAHAIERIDGSPARLRLIEDEARLMPANESVAWRLSDTAGDYFDAANGDVRLRVKLRPNRAMGRVSLPF